MTDDELAFSIMQEERYEFENEVFEVLFGIDARPYETVEEHYETLPKVFSYQEAREALAEVSKSLQLLSKIKEYFSFSCPQDEEDTEENCEMRELIDRLQENDDE